VLARRSPWKFLADIRIGVRATPAIDAAQGRGRSPANYLNNKYYGKTNESKRGASTMSIQLRIRVATLLAHVVMSTALVVLLADGAAASLQPAFPIAVHN
jgi:hypothetical protein